MATRTSNIGNKEGEGRDLTYHLAVRIQIILFYSRLGSDDGLIITIDANNKHKYEYKDKGEFEGRGERMRLGDDNNNKEEGVGGRICPEASFHDVKGG